MRKTSIALGILGASAVLLSGCASYGYDDGYYAQNYDQVRYYDPYDNRYHYERPYRYYDDGYYYEPRPRLSLGFGYSRGWYR